MNWIAVLEESQEKRNNNQNWEHKYHESQRAKIEDEQTGLKTNNFEVVVQGIRNVVFSDLKEISKHFVGRYDVESSNLHDVVEENLCIVWDAYFK